MYPQVVAVFVFSFFGLIAGQEASARFLWVSPRTFDENVKRIDTAIESLQKTVQNNHQWVVNHDILIRQIRDEDDKLIEQVKYITKRMNENGTVGASPNGVLQTAIADNTNRIEDLEATDRAMQVQMTEQTNNLKTLNDFIFADGGLLDQFTQLNATIHMLLEPTNKSQIGLKQLKKNARFRRQVDNAIYVTDDKPNNKKLKGLVKQVEKLKQQTTEISNVLNIHQTKLKDFAIIIAGK